MRVVGKHPDIPDAPRRALDIYARRYKASGENTLEDIDLETMECEKNAEEIHAIELANIVTNRTLAHYGLPAFDIPTANVRIIKASEWPKFKRSSHAFFEQTMETIFVEESELPSMAYQILNEIFHFKFYNARQFTTGPSVQNRLYRNGLTVLSRDGKTRKLNAVNEALVEELTIRYFPEIKRDALLGSRMVDSDKLIAQMQSDPRYSLRSSDTFDETYYVESSEYPPEPGALKTFGVWKYGYPKERKIFNILVSKLYETNQKQFASRDGVFDMFAKAAFTGDMSRLLIVDETFGQFTLRKIASLDKDLPALERFIANLKSQEQKA